MKLGYPWCEGTWPAWHVREPMRLEAQADGALYYWRCPECHATVEFYDEEPIDARLCLQDLVCALITSEAADELRVASPAVLVQVDPTDDPRIVELRMSKARAS